MSCHVKSHSTIDGEQFASQNLQKDLKIAIHGKQVCGVYMLTHAA